MDSYFLRSNRFYSSCFYMADSFALVCCSYFLRLSLSSRSFLFYYFKRSNCCQTIPSLLPKVEFSSLSVLTLIAWSSLETQVVSLFYNSPTFFLSLLLSSLSLVSSMEWAFLRVAISFPSFSTSYLANVSADLPLLSTQSLRLLLAISMDQHACLSITCCAYSLFLRRSWFSLIISWFLSYSLWALSFQNSYSYCC